MSDSTPPDTDRANTHDLARAAEAGAAAIDGIAGFLERIEGSVIGLSRELSNMVVREERKASLAMGRHEEICAKMDSTNTTVEQFGELLHEGIKRIDGLERRETNGHGRPAENPAE
jgi:hypothetical protein